VLVISRSSVQLFAAKTRHERVYSYVYVNFRNRFPLATKKSLRYQRGNENGKSKQDGQCNDQRKLDIHNDRQYTTQKTIDLAIRT